MNLFWPTFSFLPKIHSIMQSHITLRETIKILMRHRRIADMRNFNSSENKFAKVMIYLSMAFVVIYLIGLSIPFAMIANESHSETASEILCAIMPFVLAIDFFLRFAIQQTPSQIVRPYLLLPISRYACIDTFILSSIFTLGNLIWLAFVLPYSLMSIVFSYGIVTTIMIIVSVLLLVAANSQWYAIARTLVNSSFARWALPICIYALITAPLYCGNNAGIDQYFKIYAYFGTLIDKHNPIPLLLSASLLTGLILLNRKIQHKYVMRELSSNIKKETIKKVNKYSFLERYGDIGTFIQLEIKLITRNTNPRKAFMSGIITVLLVSGIIITSDIYDTTSMTNFWGLYNFCLLGATTLVRTMGYEGNYIDCLLVRREKILALLQAKYIFYSLLLILPFLLMLPVVLSGKWSFYMLFSYAIFTMGFQFFMVFQVAVYNKQSIPLNQKLTSKGGLDGNYIQMIVIIVVFLVPNIIIGILQGLFSDNVAYSVLLVIGCIFIATSKIWIRNIYKRMMKRKYINIESFIVTR